MAPTAPWDRRWELLAQALGLCSLFLAAGYYNLCRRTERNRSSVVITNVASSPPPSMTLKQRLGISDTGRKDAVG